MTDSTAQLRSATRRAKSDVANKLISMFLHELSRKVSQDWSIRVDGEEYGALVRERFGNRCPYCLCELNPSICVVEHLDGMNRLRAGLHVPGNVLVACRRYNGEKRRDDSQKELTLALSGWASFLSHDGERCAPSCLTCRYWNGVWPDKSDRKQMLSVNRERIQAFRDGFPEAQRVTSSLSTALPSLLAKLYADCQSFAEREIGALMHRFEQIASDESTDHTGYPAPH
ncbi:MAG: HNH endonuclease signature motif containing protein [Acidobacteriaceae bacterium]